MTTGTVAAPAASTDTVTLTVDGRSVTVPQGTTIWEAARKLGIAIPALCHKEDLNPVAVCRACVVHVEDNGSGRGERLLAASCTRACSDKMKVNTKSEDAETSRRTLVELLLAEHPRPCRRHAEAHDCELELLGEKYGILKPLYTPRAYSKGTDLSNFSIAIDHSACILCDRCVRACSDVAGNYVIGRMSKGGVSSISFDDNQPMGASSCVNCGWCMTSCPTGAITYGGGLATRMTDNEGNPIGVEIESEDLKKRLPDMFGGVNLQFLERSRGAIVARQFQKGEIICQQGEFGHTAFYIDGGAVDVFIDTPQAHIRTKEQGGIFRKMASLLVPRGEDGRKEEGHRHYIPIDASLGVLDYHKPIARVGEGELIGESACLNAQPRSATVIAAEDGTIVLEMQRNILDILRRGRIFRKQMDEKYRSRALESHLKSVPDFRDLPTEFIDRLRQKVELLPFGPGDVICRQGDAADAFYLVRMGHVRVYQSFGDGQGMVMSYLSRSQYFGETGLLYGEPRNATCTSLDHVELVRIGKDDFDEMVRLFPHIRQRLQDEAEARLKQNMKRSSSIGRVSLPQFIDQGLFEAQSLLILDLEKCTRCDECVRACAQAHDGVSRLIRSGLRYDKYLVATSCRSCRDPLCLIGCPVDAIHRKKDLQIIIEDHCIGCHHCAEQCPYGNINMQPYEATFVSTVTGKKEVRKGEKAAVCDLCDDQCLGEQDEPSCVYACPHDAAHRVDGQSFFDLRLAGLDPADVKEQPA